MTKETNRVARAKPTTRTLWCMHARKIGLWIAWASRIRIGSWYAGLRDSQRAIKSASATAARSQEPVKYPTVPARIDRIASEAVIPNQVARGGRRVPERSNRNQFASTGIRVIDNTIEP